MVASLKWIAEPLRIVQRHRWIGHFVLFPASLGSALALASWWVTEPLTDQGGPVSSLSTTAPAAPRPTDPGAQAGAERNCPSPPSWPLTRLVGAPAKARLLEILLIAAERLGQVDSYTAKFHKQERIDGKLGPVQTLEMKVRQRPFAIYLKFLSPREGKELVYAEGHHGNKLVAHDTGLSRLLVPRLALSPDHPLALADSRHAVTEAGLSNLTDRLLHFRRLDLDDLTAETELDRFTDSEGRDWLRSIHTHPEFHAERPFARVEVHYDPATFIPVEILNYDWPAPGHVGELLLAEHYAYENVDLDAELTAIDFDPANPDYEFHRY